MSCDLTTGYDSFGCRNNRSGTKAFHVRKWSASTVNTYDALDVITGTSASALLSPYYTVSQRYEQGEFMPGTGEHSPLENGTNAYMNICIMSLLKWQNTLRNFVYTIAQFEVDIIAELNNGEYYNIGEEVGANLVTSEPNIGKLVTDFSGTKLTFQAKESRPARQMSSGFISTLTFST